MAVSTRTIFENSAICEKGHLLSASVSDSPEYNSVKFCPRCGSAKITSCRSCQAPILGQRFYEKTSTFINRIAGSLTDTGRVSTQVIKEPVSEEYNVPSFCHNCGAPYPWTEATLREFDTIIEMSNDLLDDERSKLKVLFPYLLSDQPETVSASIQFSKILQKAKQPTINALRSAFASKIAGKALDTIQAFLTTW